VKETKKAEVLRSGKGDQQRNTKSTAQLEEIDAKRTTN
jgi:hypothetical protein